MIIIRITNSFPLPLPSYRESHMCCSLIPRPHPKRRGKGLGTGKHLVC